MGEIVDGQNQERDRGLEIQENCPPEQWDSTEQTAQGKRSHTGDEIDLLNQDKRGLRRRGNGGRRQIKNQNENFRFQDFSSSKQDK